MLNYLWAGMMMLGIIYAAFTGRMPDITNAALDSSKEAITLCITMIGIMSFWVGLMEIATKSRHHRTAFSKVEATDSFPVPKSSGQSPCCHPHHHEYHC